MKKIYITPQIEEYKVNVSPLLTMSDPTTGTKFAPDEETNGMDSRWFKNDDDEDF